MMNYHFLPADGTVEKPSSTWKVLLVIGKEDYHFLREVQEGFWAEKAGSGGQIFSTTTPEDTAANRGYYTVVGYFYVGPIQSEEE